MRLKTEHSSFQATIQAAQKLGIQARDSHPPSRESIDGDDCELHFIDWGREDGDRKPAIIFIHGFLQQARTWDFTSIALRDRFRCFSLDLRGHGDSGRPENPDYSTRDYLKDLESLTGHLRTRLGITHFSLCGLSLGGQLSYIYASRHPEEVRAAIIVDVAPELNREARKGVGRYIESLPKDGDFESLVSKVGQLSPMRSEQQIRDSLQRAIEIQPDGSWRWKHDPRLLEHHRSSFTSDELWSALQGVSAPTLFVMGRNSRMVSTDTLRRMVETVPGSSASYVPNASHRVPGDNPIGFIRAVKPWLHTRVLEETGKATER